MAFVPKIDFCLKDNVLQFKDITDVFSPENPEGWEDSVGGADIIQATLSIINPEGLEHTYDVTSDLPDPVNGIISFTPEYDFKLDGFYKVIYVLTTSNETFEVCREKFFYPNIKCCISNFIKNFIKDSDNKELAEQLAFIKAWQAALEYSVATLSKANTLKMFDKLTRFCKHNPCGCK